jgi:hypothetical protein
MLHWCDLSLPTAHQWGSKRLALRARQIVARKLMKIAISATQVLLTNKRHSLTRAPFRNDAATRHYPSFTFFINAGSLLNSVTKFVSADWRSPRLSGTPTWEEEDPGRV